MLLAIETAVNVCSVAFKDAAGEVHEKRTDKRGSHSEKLFLFIEELMSGHRFGIRDLEALIISEGPGSYTGLRIGASAVKGLLFQSKVPLYGVNTLRSFARAAYAFDSSLRRIHAVIDARRVHLYHQLYRVEEGRLKPDEEVRVRPLEQVGELLRKGDGLIGTGTGRLPAGQTEQAVVLGEAHISARSLIQVYEEDDEHTVRRVPPELFEPRYYTSNQVN